MFKWLFLVGFVFAFILRPEVRYTCFHLPLVFYSFVVDTYKYFKYKRYNEYKQFGKMQIYVANDTAFWKRKNAVYRRLCLVCV